MKTDGNGRECCGMKKILLLATGGTIASRNLGEGLTPALTAEELLACVPEIADVCDVTAEQVCNLDSTNMRPEHWVQIARRVREVYDAYDGFVITHARHRHHGICRRVSVLSLTERT